MTPITKRIFGIVKRIPKGFVATYGDIARAAGIGSARVVGNALHTNTDGSGVPCHRVVNAVGCVAPMFAFNGPREQERRLKKEGVNFRKPGYVDLKQHHWSVMSRPIGSRRHG